jgi:hypothetical protein
MAETSPDPKQVVAGKRKVAPTILGGFILALLEMGLPMIGVSVNLLLGGFVLAAAFALFAWGLWNWETNHNYGRLPRAMTLLVVGLIYFGLMGFQINSQYKKDHPLVSPAPQPPPQQPPAPDCKGDTGDAKASDGSIANTGNCVHDLNANPKPKEGGEKK